MTKFIIQEVRASKDAIHQIVAIHRQEIGQGFLSSLGDKALQLLFSSAVEGESGILLMATDAENDEICGFLLGATDTGRFYKEFLLKKSISAIIYLAPKLFSFEKLRKIFETLLYPSKGGLQDMPAAELLDIAISREYQGSGLAQQLFQTFSELLQTKDIEKFKITTGEDLIRAQKFYEKLGAKQIASIQVHQGQTTFVYVYDISH